MRKKKVAIDVDGVLYDLVTPWLNVYNEVYDDTLKLRNIEQYDLSKYTKCSKEEMSQLLQEPAIWEQIKLYRGVKKYIQELNNNENVDLFLVTATSYKTCKYKFDRLFELLPMLNENQLVITSRKDLIGANFFVDDWEDNLREMALTKHGVPILVTQPYNKSFPNSLYGITRADNTKEALKMVVDYIEKQKDIFKSLD